MINYKRVFIIAEAGVNHNGSIETALRMVDAAARAGADAVKFQTFKAENLVTWSAPQAAYQRRNAGKTESQLAMLKRLELPHAALAGLARHCARKKIVFMSTPFDEESADLLASLGMKTFKISSGEITNKPLIQHIAAKRGRIILSTGMSSLEEVIKALEWISEIRDISEKGREVSILHCVSNYPARPEGMNLAAMKTMKSALGLPVGLSDHTMGAEVSIAAVALGAVIIEKHFTLDKRMKGPDHAISMAPDELAGMIAAIRNVEKSMGDGIKRPTITELRARRSIRRGLVAARDIKAGKLISRNDIAMKRPATGLPPESINDVINKRSVVDIKKDSVITKENICA